MIEGEKYLKKNDNYDEDDVMLQYPVYLTLPQIIN